MFISFGNWKWEVTIYLVYLAVFPKGAVLLRDIIEEDFGDVALFHAIFALNLSLFSFSSFSLSNFLAEEDLLGKTF